MNNESVLDKKDLEAIEQITEKVSKRVVTDVLAEFWDKILAPYLDREYKENIELHKKTQEQIEVLTEHSKDHEKRIIRLETAVNP